MNLKQLEAFSAVAKSGSVTLAGRAMNLSQPAVSKLIADLEYSVGFKLFVRERGKGLLITPEGEIFLSEVERSFVGIDVLRRSARDIRDLQRGNLRIAALPALGFGFLPKVIKEYVAQHPTMTIQLQVRSSSTVRQWIANQQFDIGLASRAGDLRGVRMQSFLKCAGVAALPPGHRLARKSVIRPADLAGEPFISLAIEDPTRRRVDRVFEDADVSRNIVVETQYATTICSLVLNGLGCSILSPVVARDHLANGLVTRPFLPRIDFEYMLLTPTLRTSSQATLKFLKILNEVRDRLTPELTSTPEKP